MFDKLAPTPITEKKYRYLMICAMVWMFTGAWVDASAHTYIIAVSYTHLRAHET